MSEIWSEIDEGAQLNLRIKEAKYAASQTPTPDTPEERERFERHLRQWCSFGEGYIEERRTSDGYGGDEDLVALWRCWLASAQARTLEGLTEEEPQKDRCARGLHTPDEWTGTDGKKHLTCVRCRELLGEEARLQRVAPHSTAQAPLAQAVSTKPVEEVTELARSLWALARDSPKMGGTDGVISKMAALLTAWASKQSPALENLSVSAAKPEATNVLSGGKEDVEEPEAFVRALLAQIFDGAIPPEPRFEEIAMIARRDTALIDKACATTTERVRAEVREELGITITETGEVSDGYHTFKELYEYRRVLNALLFNQWAIWDEYDVHKSKKHSDGEDCFGGGWFIVVAQLPSGQISNHYKLEHWDDFQIPERELPATYDGHTPAIALERMKQALLAPPVTQQGGSE